MCFMALTERQLKLAELMAEKDKNKLTHQGMAEILGCSTKTIQRELQKPEVVKEIKRLMNIKLDSMLPAVVGTTEEMLSSENANTRAKGTEMFLKLNDKLKLEQELSVLDREKTLITDYIEKCVEHSSFLKDIDSKLFLEVCCNVFIDRILLKGYSQPPMTRIELNEICERLFKEHGLI